MFVPGDAMKYFIRVWIAALPRILYYYTFDTFSSSRRSLQLLQRVLEYSDLNYPDPMLGSKGIAELFGKGRAKQLDVMLTGTYYDRQASDTHQLLKIASIAYLVKAIDAKKIFEIGTSVSRMARLLAMNAIQAEVSTLDLPQDKVEHTIGICFKRTPESNQTTFR